MRVIACSVFLIGGVAIGQCQLVPSVAAGLRGVTGTVEVTAAWDPDGAGPLGEVVVVAGAIQAAGGAAAANIATWSETAGWAALASGCNAPVHCVLPLPNGELLVGGEFTVAGGAPAGHVARWDGVTWSALGAGLGGAVHGLLLRGNGDVIAVGAFAEGAAGSRVARWDGGSWSAVGDLGSGVVYSAVEDPNGALVVGGAFAAPFVNAARWDGVAWSAMGQPAYTMRGLELHQGLVYGVRGNVPAYYSIANDSWVAVTGYAGVTTLASEGAGLLLGGSFTAPANRILRLVFGVQAFGAGIQDAIYGGSGDVASITRMGNGDLVVGGSFLVAGSEPCNNVARWDGAEWRALGEGVSRGQALAAMRDGRAVLGGPAVFVGDGGSWQSIGITNSYSGVRAVLERADGTVVVGGQFTAIDGVACNNLAQWDGTSWSALGAGVYGIVKSLAETQGGDLLVGGQFTTAGGGVASNVARWDGAWHAIGAGVPWVNVVAELADGSVVVGCANQSLRWHGGVWTQISGAETWAVVQRADGDVMLGGASLARWDGASLHVEAVLDDVILSMVGLPDGDLLLGGQFTAPGKVVRWDGAALAAVGDADAHVTSACRLRDGEVLYVSGGPDFVRRLSTTCPANATLVPTACVGPAGPLTLDWRELPWIGGEYRATTDGFAPTALAITVFGFTPVNVPLASFWPTGLPGCALLASPDLVSFAIPVAGVHEDRLAIPDAPALVGAPLLHQNLQLDAAPTSGSLSASGALQLTVGSF